MLVTRTGSAKKNLHEKLGHLNMRELKNIMKNNRMHSVNIKCDEEFPKCKVCVSGKLARIPFSRSISISSNKLELIHTDICGPMRVPSLRIEILRDIR